jgi:hypothetical protein
MSLVSEPTEPPRLFTVWRLTGIRERAGLDVQLVVDTSSPLVIEAIEEAARRNEIRLERED